MDVNTKTGTFCSAILAGICIGIAGFGFLALGGLAGAILFAFGLLAVVHFRYKLFTGVIGFFHGWKEVGALFIVLGGNIVGCLLVALMARTSAMPLQETAQNVLTARLANGPLRSGVLSIGCGFIVTTAVVFGRKGQWLPLLFGVPLFIMCGFPHCIADAFYYLTVPFDFLAENAWDTIVLYVCIVAGNFLGCNLYRLILPEN